MKILTLIFSLMLPLAATAQLVEGLEGATGSTVGPGGDLYVTEGAAGRISRVDPRTGEVTPFVTGLPPSLVGFGGVTDVAFLGQKAYAIVTLVGPDVGGSDIVGLYKITGPNSYEVVADIGEFGINNPPDTEFDIPTGVQYAMEVYRGGFLITDGHHNRVLHVTRKGKISVFKAFGNIVPTGLEVLGRTIFMGQAGEAPHSPEVGKVVAFWPRLPFVWEVASGAPLIVDVEHGRGLTLFALAQGIWDGAFPGSPAMPDTGSLVRVRWNGKFSIVVDNLDRPSSLEIIKNDAYVVTLDGEIWKFDDIARPRHRFWH